MQNVWYLPLGNCTHNLMDDLSSFKFYLIELIQFGTSTMLMKTMQDAASITSDQLHDVEIRSKLQWCFVTAEGIVVLPNIQVILFCWFAEVTLIKSLINALEVMSLFEGSGRMMIIYVSAWFIMLKPVHGSHGQLLIIGCELKEDVFALFININNRLC